MNKVKEIFNIILGWIKTHVWQSIVIGGVSVTAITTAIVLPIALSNDDVNEPQVTVEAIIVETMPSKIIYEYNEDFDETGMVVSLKNSDDSKITLTSDEYTVDTSNYNKLKAGIYEIVVVFNTLDDIKTSFNVQVNAPVLVSIVANDGYNGNFVNFEEFDITSMNLEITKTYSDGSTITVSGDDLRNCYHTVDLTNPGIDKVATINVEGKTCDITYTVYDESDLSVSIIEIVGGPTSKYLTLETKGKVEDYCSSLVFEVRYNEIPNKKYKVVPNANNASFYYLPVTNAQTPGNYSVQVTYLKYYVQVPFEIVDLSQYKLEKYILDATNVPKLFFVGEEIDNSVFTNVTVSELYSKSGSPNITIPYNPVDKIALYTNNFTKTAGVKDVWLFDNGEIISTNVKYQINVVEFTLPDGEYLQVKDAGSYEKYFKVENNEFSFYRNGNYVSGYLLESFYRYVDNGTPVIRVSFKRDSSEESILLNVDGSLYKSKKLDDTFKKVLVNLMNQEFEFYFENGVVSAEMVSQMSRYGDCHLGSRNGEIINLNNYHFADGDKVYIVFQQDAVGQPFLGNYVSDEPDGCYVVVNEDGVLVYFTKADYISGAEPMRTYEYKFVTLGDNVEFTLNSEQVATFNLKTKTLTFIGMTFTLEK